MVHRVLFDDTVENRTALYAGIKEVILKQGEQLKVDYIFQLYMGRKP